MSATWVSVVVRQIRALAGGPGAEGQTDESLLESFVSQRDESAFATMMKRHGPMAMGVCLRILQDQHLAEDAFQATFLVLALKAKAIRKRGAVASWLHGVAHRLARKLKAETYRSRQLAARQDSHSLRDVLRDAGKREEQALLDEEFERLPDKYRLPLLLCYFEGRTLEEAAAALGWTAGKVKGLLDRGRERLRFRLLRRGFSLSAAGMATLLSGSALCAAVPSALTAATVRAAVKLVSGQPLAICGVSTTVANLTKGGLIMSPKKILLILALVLLTAALGVGATTWVNAGNDTGRDDRRGDQAVAHVPVPQARDEEKADERLPDVVQTSKPAKAGDLEFQIVSSVMWPLPAAAGSSGVQFHLRVTNRGKKEIRFMPVVGRPILQTDDGKELPMKMSGRNHLRALPKPVSLEAGKTITARASAQLGVASMGWEDETGMVWSIPGLKPGKYLLSLQYKTQELGHNARSVAQTGSWVGEARTAAVPVEIVDLKAAEPAVTKGLEVIALAHGTWQVPAATKQTQVCLGFRIKSVAEPKYYPWILPSISSVSIKSADGVELPVKKTTAKVPVFDTQLLMLRPKESHTAGIPAVLLHAGKSLTLAWADPDGNVWHIENLKVGRYSIRYVVRAAKGNASRPITWFGELQTATFTIDVIDKEKNAKQGVDRAAVAAYENIGATFGWLVQAELGLIFVEGHAARETGVLPAFSFKDKPLAKLPDVDIPFGLLFQSDSLTDAGLKELAGLKNLSYLRLNKTRITDAGLKVLAGCHGLYVLALHQPGLTDTGLRELAGLKKLTALHLELTPISDAGLKNLAGLVNLTTLTLGHTQVTDVGLKELAGLKNLSTFSVNFTKVTDEGLKELAPFKKLTVIGLATKHIGDAGLKELAGLEHVTTLFLGNTQVTDAGVKHLAGFQDLSWLVLGGTRVTDAGLKELARHKKLSWLVLSQTTVTDTGVKELAGLTELTGLFLDGTKITDVGLKELTGLTKLRSLVLRGTKVTNDGVALLQKSLPICQIICN